MSGSRMTSTSINVGLNDNTRASSRVLRPPGGGHTDIFGGEPEPQPPTPRRGGPPPSGIGAVVAQEETKPTNGQATETPSQNGQNGQSTPPEPAPEPKQNSPVKPEPAAQPPPKVEAPKRRVLTANKSGSNQTGQHHSRRGMEGGGRQSRLLGRLLGKLRGDHHGRLNNSLDNGYSFTYSYAMSESTGGGSVNGDEDMESETPAGQSTVSSKTSRILSPEPSPKPSCPIDDTQFAANIDLRYGGQYLTPEQLPEFCDQLHHLVEVIRNIQSYARVTGEYPSSLERRLEAEAREVAALAAEARNARDVVARTRAQRRALRAHKKQIVTTLATLRDSEVRELESTVRLSDRKLFKNWEVLKDTTDPSAFDTLIDEIKNKQAALECLLRLVDNKRSALSRVVSPPTPLPPPEPRDTDNTEDSVTTGGSGGRKRHEARRPANKRRRREPRSVPLSGEPSRHAPPPQVTLYIQGTESTSRYRVSSAGAVALAPLDLPSGGSVRDILFFTTN
ncbi:unnamed protein product [Arctia plantaginis]|uniref:Uncharacterized protein n=1 Tax=Arctia plantaginis TaxID=874455 RepID=A0A8S0ZKY2_ARCPL|nr:unnamed protein product [Arctia plantaginis]